MKKTLLFISVATMLVFTACKQQRYYDLTAGEYVDLEKDEKTGLMVRADTREPVQMYVDTRTKDTIYGPTGTVINGFIVKTGDGKYKFDEEEFKLKNGDLKLKIEGDEAKLKTDDKKVKNDDEEKKTKYDN